MKALITGASSGFGWDMAHVLSEMGYDIIAVARREDRLLKLKEELNTNVEVVVCDVSNTQDCIKLGERADEVDIFINNAGFGVFGDICSTELDAELNMIDTNIKAVHILTKTVVKKFKEKGFGHILNVASVAAYFPGPLFSSYYASKAYVLRLSQAIAQELRKAGSSVKISILCPGPVHTEFNTVANANYKSGKKNKKHKITSRYVAELAIKKMLAGKEVIVPGFGTKVAIFFRRLVSEKTMSKIVYIVQKKRLKK